MIHKLLGFITILLAIMLFIYPMYLALASSEDNLSFFPPIDEGKNLTFKLDDDVLNTTIDIDNRPSDYKSIRLREMAESWKGTSLEPHTTKLLAMLLVEDGTLTAERRHDCKNGVCYAIGFMGHNICHRGTPLIYQNWGTPYGTKLERFCSWKNGESPQKQFEKAYPEFSTNWHVQFQEYTLRMTQCIEKGNTVNQCIQSWNSREIGRIQKVTSMEKDVRLAIGI